MNTLDRVQELSNQGRFDDAFALLSSTHPAESTTARELVRAELLERLGRPHEASHIASRLLSSPTTTFSERSGCELVLCRAAWEIGDTETALEHAQRAVSYAQTANDIYRLCWAQLRLLVLIAERTSANAVAPLVSDLRGNAAKLADPVFSAALHIGLAEIETKRGLTDIARRHLDVGEKLLMRAAPNVWLRAAASNARLAIALSENDFTRAKEYGELALNDAKTSGAASAIASALINLGNAYFSVGNFDRAIDYFNQADRTAPAAQFLKLGVAETLARIQLSRGRVDEAESLLRDIDAHAAEGPAKALYVYRHSQITTAATLIRRGALDSAKGVVDQVVSIATSTGDHRLLLEAMLKNVEISVRRRDAQSYEREFAGILRTLDQASPEALGRFEGIFACALHAQNFDDAAIAHYDRARRLLGAIENTAALADVKDLWLATGRSCPNEGSSVRGGGELAESLWAAAVSLLVSNRPDLLARELLSLLERAGAIQAGKLISHQTGKTPVTISTVGEFKDAQTVQRVVAGSTGETVYQLEIVSTGAIESVAAVYAVEQLLGALAEMQSSRQSALARMQLWPNNDPQEIEQSRFVLNGLFRERMQQAALVARTKVTVLITGESGTGKEILARAVHGFSARAAHPFIPFNCTAIPRDLMEGQLFGHRRGAFTGADRDHPGLIRTARDGTLFFDEIGELSLDLQPKLLRFLESGEILPIGETQPVTIDVRVIAATNRELDRLVADGTFREDLYYRLNVVRIHVPPLRERRDEIPALAEHFVRAAAREYDKGDVRISPDAMEYLLICRWPGNVRQLANELRRIVVLAERSSAIRPEDLSPAITTGTIKPAPPGVQPVAPTEFVVRMDQPLASATDLLERTMLAYAMKQAGGSLADAAARLGLSRKGLYLKRQRLGLA